MSILDTMMNSISNNGYIIGAGIGAVVFLIASLYIAHNVEKSFDNSHGQKLKNTVYYLLDVFYTLFITIISLFPLLGMLGTVFSLIDLGNVFNSENADINAIKPDFFLALTSTAWGIIFSVFFKLVNYFLVSRYFFIFGVSSNLAKLVSFFAFNISLKL